MRPSGKTWFHLEPLGFLKTFFQGAGEMTPWLKTLGALPEDQGWILGTHMEAHDSNYRPRGFTPPFGLLGYCMCVVHIHTCRQNAHAC